jgi:hypothetical protein
MDATMEVLQVEAQSAFRRRDFSTARTLLDAMDALGRAGPATLWLCSICAAETHNPARAQEVFLRGEELFLQLGPAAEDQPALLELRAAAREWQVGGRHSPQTLDAEHAASLQWTSRTEASDG